MQCSYSPREPDLRPKTYLATMNCKIMCGALIYIFNVSHTGASEPLLRWTVIIIELKILIRCNVIDMT